MRNKSAKEMACSDAPAARRTKPALIVAIVLIAAVLAVGLSACNNAPLTEGKVVFKDYGVPVYSSSGIFDVRMHGDPDYYIKIQSGEKTQWYRVIDIDYFKEIVLGQYLVCDLTKLRAVNSMFG